MLDSNILLHAFPAFIVLALVEMIYKRKHLDQRVQAKETLTTIGLLTGSFLSGILINGIVLLVYAFIYEYRFFTLPVNWWLSWIICFFADDLSYYWYHRMSHQVRFWWASHAVHHSSDKFSLSAGLRVPWTSNITGTFLFWAWMPLIGIEPVMVIFMKSVSVIYQFWVHTETIKKLPRWFEAIFNTPSHHRVHHGSDIEYLDKNHAGTLIVWDKMFGTFREESHKPEYGLTKRINSYNPVTIAFHEWKNIAADLKKARSSKDVLNFLFNSPGWSNDGNMKTTRQLRRNNLNNKRYERTDPDQL
jgi:sterol desaturase/sphingolipid hydroxylase (fatty acid hydroxylase superfamily)